MTLPEACAILNRERHNGFAHWKAIPACSDCSAHAEGEWKEQGDSGSDEILTEFEALAIAEKYEREARAASPPAEFREPPLMPGRDVRRW